MHGIPVQPENRSWVTIKKGFTHFANGDVVVAKITPCFENGKAAVIRDLPNRIGAGTTELHVIRPLPGIESAFIYIFLRSPYFKIVGESYMTGTAGQKRLPSEYFATRPFPLPPAEEQKRIVAKVDELMALCDKLEAQQQERERRFPVLSRACHARFVESPTLANLKAIFDEAGSISTEDLRKSILALAIRGRLSNQKNSDSTAQDLLDQILLHKHPNNGENSGKAKPIASNDVPFAIPDTWLWCRLGQVSELITSGSRGWAKYYSDSGAIFVTMGNLSRNDYKLRLGKIRYVHPPDSSEGIRTQLQEEDILISITGDVGNLGLVPTGFGEAYINQHTCLLRLHICCRTRYFVEYLRSDLAKQQFNAPQRGIKNSFRLSDIEEMIVPVPPLEEQHRIVAKVNQLMALIDKLEEQQARKAKIAQAFAQAAVSAITGTEIKEPEKMKAPKTELVSRLQTRNTPNAADPAPLAKLLTEHNGELPAKMLCQRSGLEIDAFYQQLRTEMANGWIIEPEKAVMKEVEAD